MTGPRRRGPQDPPRAVRAFLALDLDATSLRRVARVSDRLRMGSGAPSAAWVLPAQMHVTLKFMALLPIAAIDPLAESVRPLVEHVPAPGACPFTLGSFPAADRARVVVAELKDAGGALAALAARLDAIAHAHGVPREDRALRPHVTLARLKRPYDARRWLRPELAEGAGECRAAGVTLFRSDIGPQGATYVPLARFIFEPPPERLQ
jgi:RNA 2',3'-cyclic 3'-phosphodiesterase